MLFICTKKTPFYNDTKDLSNKVHVKYNTRTKQWLKATHDLSDTTILFIVVDPSFERNTLLFKLSTTYKM